MIGMDFDSIADDMSKLRKDVVDGSFDASVGQKVAFIAGKQITALFGSLATIRADKDE